MLVDDRLPPPDERRPVEPNWRLIGWLAVAAVLVFGGLNTEGFVAYLIVCATVYAVCNALATLFDYPLGLHEHRQ